MNKRIKTKWIKALRSGKYKQTKSVLKAEDANVGGVGYCCLGVLCDLYGEETGVKWSKTQVTYCSTTGFRFGQSDRGYGLSVLPKNVMLWAGLKDGSPNLPSGDSLADLNDNGVSFKRIATKIEKYLE